MTLTPVGLALKLSEGDRANLLAAGGTELRYFPNAPAKKDYVVLPPDLVEETGALEHWIGRSTRHSCSGRGQANT